MCLSLPGELFEFINPQESDPLARRGRVKIGALLQEVSLSYVPEVKIGDYVLIHVGFAISIIDEAEAHFIFEYFKNYQNQNDLEPTPDLARKLE